MQRRPSASRIRSGRDRWTLRLSAVGVEQHARALYEGVGYEFNDVHAPFPFQQASFPYGAAHTLEMRYIFKDYTGAVGELKPLSPGQTALAGAMVGYWTTFARTGNPNAEGARQWPALDNRGMYLSLVPPVPELISSAKIDAEHQCSSFWHSRSNR